MKTVFFWFKNRIHGNILLLTLFLTAVVLMFSGSAVIPDKNVQEKETNQKKISLLEKLESGLNITPEEIQSAFSNNRHDDFLIPEFPDMPCFPDLSELRDNHYMRDFISPEVFIEPFEYNFDIQIPDSLYSGMDCFKIDKEKLKSELREIENQIKHLKNTGECEQARKEFRKSMDQFRDEMRKAKEEFSKEFGFYF